MTHREGQKQTRIEEYHYHALHRYLSVYHLRLGNNPTTTYQTLQSTDTIPIITMQQAATAGVNTHPSLEQNDSKNEQRLKGVSERVQFSSSFGVKHKLCGEYWGSFERNKLRSYGMGC